MNEYICESNDDYPEIEINGFNVRCEITYILKETIVRCRDCYFYDHWDASGPYREKHVCGYWDYLEIEPNGFCAWGERRDNA